MEISTAHILASMEKIAPFHLAEKWDNVGLLVGNPNTAVTGIMLGLDASHTLIDEATEKGCNVIIVHHPVIFQPLKSIDTSTAEGRLLQKVLTRNISIIACHTNFDSSSDGVSDYFAKELGLTLRRPLRPSSPQDEPQTGLGCIGCYPEAIRSQDFLRRLLELLKLPGVQVAGTLPEKITHVALCGGSGSDFAELARAQGADLYLTAEIKHHTALWAAENHFCIIDGSHYATEKPAMHLLGAKLMAYAAAQRWDTPIIQAETEKHPFVFMSNNKS